MTDRNQIAADFIDMMRTIAVEHGIKSWTLQIHTNHLTAFAHCDQGKCTLGDGETVGVAVNAALIKRQPPLPF